MAWKTKHIGIASKKKLKNIKITEEATKNFKNGKILLRKYGQILKRKEKQKTMKKMMINQKKAKELRFTNQVWFMIIWRIILLKQTLIMLTLNTSMKYELINFN